MAAVFIPDEATEPTIPVLGDSLVAEAPSLQDVDDEPVEEDAETTTRREQVALLQEQGKTWRAIAAEMGISEAWARALSSTRSDPNVRNRRPREVRARSINVHRMTKRDLVAGRALYPEADEIVRPKTRGDCADGIRPCPFVGCKHHLYLDVTPAGSIKLNFPDIEPDQMAETCALDIADCAHGHVDAVTEPPDDGEDRDEDPEPPAATLVDKNRVGPAFGNTLENVARAMNLTRERVRQIETKALRTLGVLARRAGLDAYQGHAHDQDYAEIIPHQLPIVKRDTKPENVRRLRVFAPDVAAIGSDDRDGFVEYESANEEPASSGADPNEPADFTPNEDEESITPEPEENAMTTCARSGCENEARKPRLPVPPGMEGWCAPCRRDAASVDTVEEEEPPPRKPKKKPRVVRGPKAARISKSKPTGGDGPLDPNVSLAELLKAYELVTSVGIEFVESLHKRMASQAR